MSGGIRPEGQPVALRRPAEVVQHHARLHPGHPPVGVDLDDPRHMARHVEHHGLVARLTGEAGAGAAGQERRPRLGGEPRRGPDVVVVDGEDDPERYVAVVGRVAGVRGPGRGVEAHLAAQGPGQRRPQRQAVRLFELGGPCRHERPTGTARVAP